MLGAAASGLREAITGEIRSTYAVRLAALDRRLGSPAGE
jgi:hypothetical protein